MNSKKGKGRAETSSASNTSQGSTRSSSPQARNVPTSTISSPITRHVPAHLIFQDDDDDSDYENIYVPHPNMNISDINGIEPEAMEYTHVGSLERGDDVSASDLGNAGPIEEGKKHPNLWSSEDDPRAVPLPAIICPVHHIGCKKGICEDMSKKMKEIKRLEMKAKWDEENLKRNKGNTFSLPDK